jgi:hypothetical protein
VKRFGRVWFSYRSQWLDGEDIQGLAKQEVVDGGPRLVSLSY